MKVGQFVLISGGQKVAEIVKRTPKRAYVGAITSTGHHPSVGTGDFSTHVSGSSLSRKRYIEDHWGRPLDKTPSFDSKEDAIAFARFAEEQGNEYDELRAQMREADQRAKKAIKERLAEMAGD